MGNQNNIVKLGVPGFFGCSGVPGCSGVFRSVPDCFGVPVFLCSGVPVFLALVHVILLTIFDGVPRFSTCHSFNHF